MCSERSDWPCQGPHTDAWVTAAPEGRSFCPAPVAAAAEVTAEESFMAKRRLWVSLIACLQPRAAPLLPGQRVSLAPAGHHRSLATAPSARQDPKTLVFEKSLAGAALCRSSLWTWASALGEAGTPALPEVLESSRCLEKMWLWARKGHGIFTFSAFMNASGGSSTFPPLPAQFPSLPMKNSFFPSFFN